MLKKLLSRNKLVISLIFLLPIFLLLNCAKEKGSAPKDNSSACDTLNNITYTGVVDSIVNRACAVSGCHIPSGTGNGDFTSYAGVKSKVDNGSFKNRVLETKDMPPTNSGIILSDCEMKILQAWLNKGAPN